MSVDFSYNTNNNPAKGSKIPLNINYIQIGITIAAL